MVNKDCIVSIINNIDEKSIFGNNSNKFGYNLDFFKFTNNISNKEFSIKFSSDQIDFERLLSRTVDVTLKNMATEELLRHISYTYKKTKWHIEGYSQLDGNFGLKDMFIFAKDGYEFKITKPNIFINKEGKISINSIKKDFEDTENLPFYILTTLSDTEINSRINDLCDKLQAQWYMKIKEVQ